MKKVVVGIALCAVVYFVVGVAAWMTVLEDADRSVRSQKSASARAEEWRRDREADRVAMARLKNDQALVSQRMKAITDETLGKGKDKVAEVSAVLSDPDLNLVAQTYLGSDWSVQRSAFLGSVRHMREIVKMQKSERARYKSRLNEKIEQLERRKRQLSREMYSPSSERQWRVEMDDIERQLYTFRTSNTYREYLQKDSVRNDEIKAEADNESAIFKMAVEYQTETAGKLMMTLATQQAALQNRISQSCEPWQSRSSPLSENSMLPCFRLQPLKQMAQLILTFCK